MGGGFSSGHETDPSGIFHKIESVPPPYRPEIQPTYKDPTRTYPFTASMIAHRSVNTRPQPTMSVEAILAHTQKVSASVPLMKPITMTPEPLEEGNVSDDESVENQSESVVFLENSLEKDPDMVSVSLNEESKDESPTQNAKPVVPSKKKDVKNPSGGSSSGSPQQMSGKKPKPTVVPAPMSSKATENKFRRDDEGLMKVARFNYDFVVTPEYKQIFTSELDYDPEKERILLLEANVVHATNPLPCSIKATIVIDFMTVSEHIRRIEKTCEITKGFNESMFESIYQIPIEEEYVKKIVGKERIFNSIPNQALAAAVKSPDANNFVGSKEKIYFKGHGSIHWPVNEFMHCMVYEERGAIMENAKSAVDVNIYKSEGHEKHVCFSTGALRACVRQIRKKYLNRMSYVSPVESVITISADPKDYQKIDDWLDKVSPQDKKTTITVQLALRYLRVRTDDLWLKKDTFVRDGNLRGFLE